jgi:GGDEF domain-containing protein
MPVHLQAARRAAPPVASPRAPGDAVTDGDRTAALISEGLLDGGPDPSFDRFARVAARVAGVARALVSIVATTVSTLGAPCTVPPPPEQLVAEADRALYRAKRGGATVSASAHQGVG